MDVLQRVTHFFKTDIQLEPNDHLLLAVSGGADSAVLAALCHQAGYRFSIAHCNFQLRGDESSRDEAFVRQMAAGYNVPVYVQVFDTAAYAEAGKLGIQEAARKLRYEWFEALRPAAGARCIVTAHHLNDNVETVLMNVFRGTGMAGMRGMLPVTGHIVRPLLRVKRSELETWAAAKGVAYVEDSSNTLDKYSRNFIRNRVLPLITEKYPQAEEHIAAGIERFREMELVYNEAIAQKIKKLAVRKGGELHIPVLKLKRQQAMHTLVYELMRDFGFTPAQVGGAVQLLDAQTGRFIDSATHRMIKNRGWLIVAPLNTAAARHILIDEADTHIQFEHGNLVLSRIAAAPGDFMKAGADTAWLNANAVQFPLLLRPFKAGDYFYPLGMKKKKKLARFFIDQKLSKTEKERVWVLESNKRIIWVVGRRIDDRVKISLPGGQVLKISLISAPI